MEAVLQVPCSQVSQVYYKRKWCCYNLSVYSLKDGNASCFLWNETEGKRWSYEIATCVQLYLKSLSSQISHVCLYSDSCGGQNRNRFMSVALLHAVGTIPNISVIDQNFSKLVIQRWNVILYTLLLKEQRRVRLYSCHHNGTQW
jgi:hypothetical protein